MSAFRTLELEQRGAVRWLWLNRPDVRNALNDALIAELSTAFAQVESASDTRVVVVAARGVTFCAGADLNWMRATADYSHAQNHADAMKIAQLFQAVHACSRPVIARVQGDAFGGGVGLAAACDLVVAIDSANFSLSEVKLGLVAATISPHLVRAMGARQAARYMLTAERFSAAQACAMGLVNECASAESLDGVVGEFAQALLRASPAALAATKRLLGQVAEQHLGESLLRATAACIADARVSSEGREGIAAFLERRKPSWVDE